PACHSPRVCFLPASRAGTPESGPLTVLRRRSVSVAAVGVVVLLRADRLGLSLVVAGVVAALLVVAAAVVPGIVLAAARGTLIAAAAILALLVVRGVLAPQLPPPALEGAHGLAHVAGLSRPVACPQHVA